MSSTPPSVSPDLTDTCQSDRYAENDKCIPLLCLVTDHTEPSEVPRNVIIKINGIRCEGAGGWGGGQWGRRGVFFFFSFSFSSVICVTHGFLNRPQFSVLEHCFGLPFQELHSVKEKYINVGGFKGIRLRNLFCFVL